MRACSRYVEKTALFTWPIASQSRKRTCSRIDPGHCQARQPELVGREVGERVDHEVGGRVERRGRA